MRRFNRNIGRKFRRWNVGGNCQTSGTWKFLIDRGGEEGENVDQERKMIQLPLMKLNMIERCNIRMEIPISDTITDNVKNGEIRMIREILVRLIIFFFFLRIFNGAEN